MIRLQHISYSAGGRAILEDVSLNVYPGQFVAIAGANGAGKSTLLNIATKSIRPGNGRIEIDGRQLRDWKPAELATRAAVLHQKSTLNLPFTVRDVVAMGRYPHGSPELDAEIISAVLRQCGILHLAESTYTELSGGEQQRVHLARAFAQVRDTGDGRCRYLFLDEPGNNLDIRFQHESLQLARTFAAAGNCVMAVLHDLNLIMQYADSVVLLKAGRVLASGPVTTALSEDSVSAAYDYPVRFISIEDGLPFIVPEAGAQKSFSTKFQTLSL